MCVNDIITSGAKPLFFLDYFATSKLDNSQAKRIIKGIADGCLQSEMALIGGETAEMPGVYQSGEFDLAGFSVGIVDYKKIIDGSKNQKVIQSLVSLHPDLIPMDTLIRKLIEDNSVDLDEMINGEKIGAIIKPTIIYSRSVLSCIEKYDELNGSHYWRRISREYYSSHLRAARQSSIKIHGAPLSLNGFKNRLASVQ